MQDLIFEFGTKAMIKRFGKDRGRQHCAKGEAIIK